MVLFDDVPGEMTAEDRMLLRRADGERLGVAPDGLLVGGAGEILAILVEAARVTCVDGAPEPEQRSQNDRTRITDQHRLLLMKKKKSNGQRDAIEHLSAPLFIVRRDAKPFRKGCAR
ncbi:hypothetical protein WMF04_29175 [Sorangium sp. So ce260]|uniref:hypothetical protein n=1 Tax=Sorangium sp. So ce260 TaxID=3133291 RepID=UPI003F62211F